MWNNLIWNCFYWKYYSCMFYIYFIVLQTIGINFAFVGNQNLAFVSSPQILEIKTTLAQQNLSPPPRKTSRKPRGLQIFITRHPSKAQKITTFLPDFTHISRHFIAASVPQLIYTHFFIITLPHKAQASETSHARFKIKAHVRRFLVL